MRKLLLVFLVLASVHVSFALPASLITPAPKASNVFVTVGKQGTRISLQELSAIKLKDFERLTESRLKLGGRIGFKLAQARLKRAINSDGSLEAPARVLKSFDEESSFHLGGFVLGFLLGPIGVIIAYLINDDNKRSRRKSAWRGFLLLISLSLAVALLLVG